MKIISKIIGLLTLLTLAPTNSLAVEENGVICVNNAVEDLVVRYTWFSDFIFFKPNSQYSNFRIVQSGDTYQVIESTHFYETDANYIYLGFNNRGSVKKDAQSVIIRKSAKLASLPFDKRTLPIPFKEMKRRKLSFRSVVQCNVLNSFKVFKDELISIVTLLNNFNADRLRKKKNKI